MIQTFNYSKCPSGMLIPCLSMQINLINCCVSASFANARAMCSLRSIGNAIRHLLPSNACWVLTTGNICLTYDARTHTGRFLAMKWTENVLSKLRSLLLNQFKWLALPLVYRSCIADVHGHCQRPVRTCYIIRNECSSERMACRRKGPEFICSRERTVPETKVPGNEWSKKQTVQGMNGPWNKWSMDAYWQWAFPGPFISWTVHSLELSFPRTKVPLWERIVLGTNSLENECSIIPNLISEC